MKNSHWRGCAATVGLMLSLISGTGTATTSATEELRFRVLLDEQKIGYHHFRIVEQGNRKLVESDADFDVRLMFIPVYSYRHENTEVWRDGCLARISSRTDANGKRYAVQGERRDGIFAIGTPSQTETLARDCVMSFAYWNPEFLSQRRLLNAQTGELLEVAVEPVGTRALSLGDREVLAEGFRVQSSGKGVDITVWYGVEDGRWVALESLLDGGKRIRYLPVEAEGVALANNRAVAGRRATP